MLKEDLEKILQDLSEELELSNDKEIIRSLGREYIHYQLIYMKKYGSDFRPKKLY